MPFLGSILIFLEQFNTSGEKVSQVVKMMMESTTLQEILHLLDHLLPMRHVLITLPVTVHPCRHVISLSTILHGSGPHVRML
jgi:hypothetical protein